MEKIRVFIVDDHPPLRDGLKSTLSEAERLDVCGEAGDADTALKEIADTEPDIVLLDLSLHGNNEFGLIKQIRSMTTAPKVVILSMYNNFECIRQALLSGARGYLSKESLSYKVVEAVERVHEGEYYLDSFTLTPFIQAVLNAPPEVLFTTDGKYGKLSTREQEIFRTLAEGQTCKEIGSRLFISAKTVENHRSNIMKKLELSSHIELFNYARSLSIIE